MLKRKFLENTDNYLSVFLAFEKFKINQKCISYKIRDAIYKKLISNRIKIQYFETILKSQKVDMSDIAKKYQNTVFPWNEAFHQKQIDEMCQIFNNLKK